MSDLNELGVLRDNFIDKIIRIIRLKQVLPSIKAFENPRVLDVGCGFEARLLREIEPYIAKGVGIDFKAPKIHTKKLETFSYFFEEKGEILGKERERRGYATK